MKKWFHVIIPLNDYTSKVEFVEFGSDKEIKIFTEKKCVERNVNVDYGITIFELTKSGKKEKRSELTKNLNGVRLQTVQERNWM